MITIYRAVNFAHKTSVQRGKLTHSPTVDRLQTTEVSMARHVDSAQSSWLSFFCGWRDIFCPLKSVLSPQIQHLGNISPDMTYFSFPRNIPWTLTSINVFPDARPWGVEKKCYTCEYHHAASKLDKLNGAVKNIFIKSSSQIFIHW